MEKENISLTTFRMLVKAGILIGRANPNADIDKLIDRVFNEFLNYQIKEIKVEDTNN